MSRQKIELQYYSTLSYPNKTTLLNCVSYISGSNRFPAYAEYLLVSNIHFVFSTKERAAVLGPPIRERLFPYMGGFAKRNGLHPKCSGGVADHVHLLLGSTG